MFPKLQKRIQSQKQLYINIEAHECFEKNKKQINNIIWALPNARSEV